MIKRCGECLSKNIKMKNIRGQRFTWKDYPSVLLSTDFECLQCLNCGELIFSGKDSAGFDEVIKKSIKAQIGIFIETILEREGCSQVAIASHLGTTPEYLSECKSGRKQPTFSVFNFLKILAIDENAFKEAQPDFLSKTMIKKLSA